jgi:ABC-type multidrug transport system permease subunit
MALLPEGDSSYILGQGNEPESVVELTKVVNAYHDLGLRVEETTAVFEDFGRTEPPLKKMLVNITLLFTSVLAGMLISINIVEEKMDNTVSAINVSPISRIGFILGKSAMGIFLAVYGSIAVVLITGYTEVNYLQMLLAILAVTILSILIGFIEGLVNDDVMNAAAGIKMLFLPIGAAVAAVELLNEQWQILFYWVPFYWSYRGNDAILSYTATWPQILGYTAIIILLCAGVYYFLAPKIQKGLAV